MALPAPASGSSPGPGGKAQPTGAGAGGPAEPRALDPQRLGEGKHELLGLRIVVLARQLCNTKTIINVLQASGQPLVASETGRKQHGAVLNMRQVN